MKRSMQLFLLLFLISIYGKAQVVTSLNISPTTPTTSDIITLTSDVLFSSGSCHLDYSSIEIEGNQITITAHHTLGIASYMCENTSEFEIGSLDEGEYEVNYLLTTNFSQLDTISETIYFTVQNPSMDDFVELAIVPTNPTETDSIFLMANIIVPSYTTYTISSNIYHPSYNVIKVHIEISIDLELYSTGFPEIETHSVFLGTKIPGDYEVIYVFYDPESEVTYDELHKDTIPFSVHEASGLNQTTTEQIIPLSLTEGWNMIGYTCVEPINVEEAFASIVDKIIIVKDNLGNVYLPNLGFNGLENLEFAKGYQLKLTEDINDFYFCPSLIQSE